MHSDIKTSSQMTKEQLLNFDNWNGMSLRKSLTVNTDFILVNATLWQLLKMWFKGGPTIRLFVPNSEPDVHPVAVTLVDKEASRGILISLKITDSELRNYLAETCNYISSELEIKVKADEGSAEQTLYNDNKPLNAYNIKPNSIIILSEKAFTDSTIEEEKDVVFDIGENEMLRRAIEASLRDVPNFSPPNFTQRERAGATGEPRKHDKGHKTPSTGESTPTWKHKSAAAFPHTNGYQYLFRIVKQ
eukprot:TRINITY_DN7522_c0_g1_i6.p1 TRINITY_DN7522_c0_g1~~TRINITY_DN7522_c0_g1_i6.p1  ORF type:complete len:246 (+),score=31.91 TRINITY_DN7522_c0_g1_i6:322-1059(+)